MTGLQADASRVIDLTADGAEARIAPGAGGVVLSLTIDGTDILRRTAGNATEAAGPLASACYPCVPYFGRLFGDLAYGGRRWPLVPTLTAASADAALHGEGWIEAWRVVATTETTAELEFQRAAGEPGRFPFPYRARQAFALSTRALTIRLEVENAGETPMPAGLALHPFFARTMRLTVAFEAAAFWTPPGVKGMRGALSERPDALGSGGPAPLPATHRDHTYFRLASPVTLDSGARPVVITTDAAHLHIYAPTGQDFYCIEPVTHLPGALTEGPDGGRGDELAPGASLALSMTIAVG